MPAFADGVQDRLSTVGQVDALLSENELTLLAETEYSEEQALALNTRLRQQGLAPERAAAVMAQAQLRRQARSKFGPEAEGLLFTRAGLEQATRRAVAEHHAARFRAAGLHSVADLGCGIGADSLALARAGLEVTAVEIDPDTAAAAAHNLAPHLGSRVVCADLQELDLASLQDRQGRPLQSLWLDPARREPRGGTAGRGSQRIFDPEAFAPPFSAVRRLAATGIPLGVKMGPGMDHRAIPPEAEAEWIGHGPEVVELVLWFNALARPGVRRSATLLGPDPLVPEVRTELASAEDFGSEAGTLPVAEPGAFLWEPHGAVIRAELVGELVSTVQGHLIDPRIAYVSGEHPCPVEWASSWRVVDRLPLHAKALKRWAREEGITSLTIKKRGVDVVPETLRKQVLAGTGKARAGKKGRHATLVLTRWDAGTGEQRAAFHVEPA